MGLSDQPFEVSCPDCGAILKIDPVSRAIIADDNPATLRDSSSDARVRQFFNRQPDGLRTERGG